jgi:hypothetical protein
MTDAKRQPSFLRGLGIIVLSYLVTWHLAFLVFGWSELRENPREFFGDYAHFAHMMLIPYAASPHDGEPILVQVTALGVGIIVAIVVIVRFAWKRPGDND